MRIEIIPYMQRVESTRLNSNGCFQEEVSFWDFFNLQYLLDTYSNSIRQNSRFVCGIHDLYVLLHLLGRMRWCSGGTHWSGARFIMES
jgi:hypothetical protein